MKNVEFFVRSSIILTLVFLMLESNAQSISQCIIDQWEDAGSCDVVDYPYVYPGECSIGINRFISRTANADGLDDFIQSGPCTTTNPTVGDLPAGSNGTALYNLCYGGGCTSNYVHAIQSFIAVKATFIARATNASGNDQTFRTPGIPGYNSDHYEAAVHVVDDINAVYDCELLPRPVIQAAILEAIGASSATFDAKVPIPSSVIADFKSEMINSGSYSYYFNTGNDTPRSDRLFRRAVSHSLAQTT